MYVRSLSHNYGIAIKTAAFLMSSDDGQTLVCGNCIGLHSSFFDVQR